MDALLKDLINLSSCCFSNEAPAPDLSVSAPGPKVQSPRASAESTTEDDDPHVFFRQLIFFTSCFSSLFFYNIYMYLFRYENHFNVWCFYENKNVQRIAARKFVDGIFVKVYAKRLVSDSITTATNNVLRPVIFTIHKII